MTNKPFFRINDIVAIEYCGVFIQGRILGAMAETGKWEYSILLPTTKIGRDKIVDSVPEDDITLIKQN